MSYPEEMGTGICPGDGKTEALGVPVESGRSDHAVAHAPNVCIYVFVWWRVKSMRNINQALQRHLTIWQDAGEMTQSADVPGEFC